MHKLGPSLLTAAAVLASASVMTVVVLRGPPSSTERAARAVLASTSSAHRPLRPSPADWERIKMAARLRRMALKPHRTAHYRSFTAFLGLTELTSIHPLAAGKCANAVTYLYNNLLDLYHASPGENWAPLRQAVATEPSIRVCAPRPRSRPRSRPRYVE